MINVEKIQLCQLEDFIKSDKFIALKEKPISTIRADSYVKNPNAKPTDVVLYIAFINAKIVGYRTVWKDVFFDEDLPIYFGWLSGNWVRPSYRRKGVSTRLFNEVFKDWGGKLMYTNYATFSKLVYDKTKHFKEVESLVGTRFYTRFCLADILPKKSTIYLKTKFLFTGIDFLGNVLLDIRLLFSSKNKATDYTIKKNEEWNTAIFSFIKIFKEKELFKREETIFSWIKNYPWVNSDTKAKNEAKNYFFSVFAKNFENDYYTFYNVKGSVVAFLWLNIRNGHLKIPYIYFSNENEKNVEEVLKFIITKSKELKVKTVLVYNTIIEKKLKEQLFFLTKKIFNQKYFAAKRLKSRLLLIKNKDIQSGDGDGVFT